MDFSFLEVYIYIYIQAANFLGDYYFPLPPPFPLIQVHGYSFVSGGRGVRMELPYVVVDRGAHLSRSQCISDGSCGEFFPSTQINESDHASTGIILVDCHKDLQQ